MIFDIMLLMIAPFLEMCLFVLLQPEQRLEFIDFIRFYSFVYTIIIIYFMKIKLAIQSFLILVYISRPDFEFVIEDNKDLIWMYLFYYMYC